jgi:GT2 family glycosyltransferase
MRLSVIIPTHNRVKTLSRVLSALSRQSLAKQDFEVIVVDDGSEEPVRAKVRALDVALDYTLVEKAQGGLASARNCGADRAEGEILHFLDDDVVPAEDTLRQHVLSHDEAPSSVAVVGSLPYPPEVERNAFLWYLERTGHYDLYKNPRKYPGGVPPMPPLNGNSSVGREVFFEIGPYDEGFECYGSEDLDLGYRLHKAGIEFVYNRRAVGYHDHVKNSARFCADMETAGESLIRLYEKHPEIRVPKKIDVLTDPFLRLPMGKKLYKAVLSVTLACPWLLAIPRRVTESGERHYALRYLLFPLFRWLGHYHYALGMRRGLKRLGSSEALQSSKRM